MSELALRLDNVTRRYGNGITVGPISCGAERGKFISLLGPSGCGKTTILRCIAGFEFADEGTVSVDGRDITHEKAYRRKIGLVFQNFALFPHLTVAENVAFGLKIQRIPRAEQQARIAETLRMVEMEDLGARYPGQLSGGQQQRVAIARSLVMRPAIMLLDEPLSSLDYKLRLQMRRELRALQRRLEMTFIYVTHDQTEALALSDKIIVLAKGRIAEEGSPDEIYYAPKTRYVAGFIGTPNLFDIESVEYAGDVARAVIAPAISLTVRVREKPRIAQTYSVCVRPQAVRIVGEAERDLPNSFLVKTIDEAFLGEQREITARILRPDDGAESDVRIRLYSQARPAERMRIAIDPEAMLLVRNDA